MNHYKFTGDERDAETGLDHTWVSGFVLANPEREMFRQYSSQFDRWMTPDPAGLAAADPSNPQSWNRYAYVLNNPLLFMDPTGLDTCYWDYVSYQLICIPTQTTTVTVDGGSDAGLGTFAGGGSGAEGMEDPGSLIWCVREAHSMGIKGNLIAYCTFKPQSPGSSFWQRTASVNQCAASTANKYSVAALTHTQNLPVAGSLFSNYFSSASQLIFGPGRVGAAGSLATNAASFGVSPVANAAGAIPVSSGYQFLFSSTPATAFAETAVGKATIGAVGAASAALTYEAVGQFFYDAATYATSLVTCSLR